jgi:hypothetical protein
MGGLLLWHIHVSMITILMARVVAPLAPALFKKKLQALSSYIFINIVGVLNMQMRVPFKKTHLTFGSTLLLSSYW